MVHTLEQAGIVITEGLTQPSRPGKQPRPVWEVAGDVFGYESQLYAIGGKKWRGKFSFWEDPTEAIVAMVANTERESFADRQAGAQERAGARAERLSERAGKHEETAEAASREAWRIVEMIPNGQPILVGHHSEGRHRRDISRIDKKIQKACEEREYAGELRRRAELNEEKAAGEHLTPSYIQNRIDEAEARIRQIERAIEGGNRWDQGTRESRAADYAAELAERQERAAYWREQLAQIGGVKYGRHNVKKGDRVNVRGWWAIVVRANEKTCSVEYEAENLRGFGGPAKWTDIADHEPAE